MKRASAYATSPIGLSAVCGKFCAMDMANCVGRGAEEDVVKGNGTCDAAADTGVTG